MPPKRKPQPKVTTKEESGNVYSNFMITINPNQHYSDELREKLIDASNAIFRDGDVYKYIKFKQDGDIIDFNIHIGTPEVGGNKGRLHLHVAFELEHQAKLQVDVAELKKDFTEKLGSTPYVFVKLQNDYRVRARNYTDKSI